MIRRTGQLLLVGLLSGLVFLGIGGRVAMRGVALAVDRPTNFGLSASAGIALIGSVLGLSGGILFALAGSRLPGSATAKGLLFGTLYFALLIPIQPTAVQEEIAAFHGHLWLATICFWFIFGVSGITLSEVVARRNTRQLGDVSSVDQV